MLGDFRGYVPVPTTRHFNKLRGSLYALVRARTVENTASHTASRQRPRPRTSDPLIRVHSRQESPSDTPQKDPAAITRQTRFGDFRFYAFLDVVVFPAS